MILGRARSDHDPFAVYGNDAAAIHVSLPTIKAQVIRVVRGAIEATPVVASIMAEELGRDDAWQRSQVESFRSIAETCLP